MQLQEAYGLAEEDSGMPPQKRVKVEEESSPDNKEVAYLDNTIGPL